MRAAVDESAGFDGGFNKVALAQMILDARIIHSALEAHVVIFGDFAPDIRGSAENAVGVVAIEIVVEAEGDVLWMILATGDEINDGSADHDGAAARFDCVAANSRVAPLAVVLCVIWNVVDYS